MLTSLIRKPPPPHPPETPEDILDNTSLTLFFPDAQKTFHGDPGSHVTYASRKYGDIKLQLVDPEGGDERWLFAHHVWNSGVLLAEYISNADGPAPSQTENEEVEEEEEEEQQNERKRWSVKGERVLELGAGTGLVSIISALSGATSTTSTDYPSPKLLSTLQSNLSLNLPPSLLPTTTITAHEWGATTDKLTAGHAYSFTRVIACDCLWLDGEHEALARSIRHFLCAEEEEGARAWVVAGYHTGKRKVAGFFETARRCRLEVEWIREVGTGFEEREWRAPAEGEGEDLEGRNRWMVVAVLRVVRAGEQGG